MSDERPLPGAAIGPLAAAVMDQRYGRELRRIVRDLQGLD